MARVSLASLLLVVCLTFSLIVAVPCSARDDQKRLPEIDVNARIGPSGNVKGVTLDNGASGAGGVFGVSQAPADTFYYGGTAWDAADGRWEAAPPSGPGWANRNTWTWSANGFGTVPHSGLNMDGWRGDDQSADAADRFHVQSTAEIGACVIAGQKSLFCGLTNAECAQACYADLVGTGYGNSWNQYVCTPTHTFHSGALITLSYGCTYESEGSYDFTYVVLQTWDSAESAWVNRDTLRSYSGAGNVTESLGLDALMAGLTPPVDFRIVFNFQSDGGYSDADGFNPTACGAFALDTYTLDDNGTVYLEDFENTPVGALPAGWQRFSMGVGDFAAVKHLDELAVPLAEDPCLALAPGMCQIADSVLALFDPAVPSYPHPQMQNNIAFSPVIDLSDHSGLGGMLFTFDRFAKLPLDDHVFYVWQVRYRPACASGGWSSWLSDNYVYYTPEGTSCATISFDVSSLIPAGAEDVQIALGVVNGCEGWEYSGCETCNETPYFDNVTVGVYGSDVAPYVSMREFDYWQDQFAEDGTLDPESTADSRTPNYLTNLNPPIFGDTLVCRSSADDAEIYFVFRLAAVGPGQNLAHGFFTSWFPGVTGGDWVEARMDTAEVTTTSGMSTAPSPGSWMCAFHESDPVSLANGLPEGTEIIPNNVFVPGTRIEYFIKSKYTGSSDYFLLPDTTGGRREEFEILPMMRGSLITGVTWPCLIVADHFGGRGVGDERNADRIRRHLAARGIEFDMYNKLGPTANLSNGIGRGSANPGQIGQPGDDQYCCPPGATAAQMDAYNFCILNAGSVYGYSVCQSDVTVLTTWLDSGLPIHPLRPRFLWLSGDLIARELNRRTPWGPAFLNDVLCATYVSASYWVASGDGTYCLPVNGLPGARVAHDALGSFTVRTNNCPRRQYGFNVLGLSSSGVCSGAAAGGDSCGARAEAQFHADYGGSAEIAAVSNLKMLSCWTTRKTFLEGYDFCLVRSDDSQGPSDCGSDDFLVAWLDSVLTWGGHSLGQVCDAAMEDHLVPPSVENSSFVWQNPLCDSTRLLFCPGCPREGMGECSGSSLLITLRDQFNSPIPGVEVCAELSPDSSVYMCSPAGGVTDQSAEVELKFAAGLEQTTTDCRSVEVKVYAAYGWLMYDDTLVVLSPDLNGDRLVDREDSLIFVGDYGTTACRSDFDCDGIVGGPDWAIFSAHFGHGCPSAVIGVGEKPGVSAPAITSLDQNFPNPFNPSTGIRLSVREAGRVVLRVHDIAGRPVRTLVDAWKEPGVYQVSWDGRDDDGRQAASGVYFYSLVTAGERATRKMVLVR